MQSFNKYEFNGRVLAFGSDHHSVVVNDQVPGEAFLVTGFSVCRGFLNGFLGLQKLNHYEVPEVGLHLKTGMFAEMRRLGFLGEVGHLTAAYNGEDETLLQHRPSTGVAVLGWMNRWVTSAIYPDAGPAPKRTEENSVTKQRRTFYKHMAIDAILLDRKFRLSPSFKDQQASIEADSFIRDEKALQNWLAAYERRCTLTNEEDAAEFAAAMQDKGLNRSMAKNYARIEQGEVLAGGVQAVFGVDGKEIPSADLVGKRVQYYHGALPIGVPRHIDASSLMAALAMIQDRSLTVEIVS